MKRIVLFGLLLSIVGCSGSGHLNTPSGKPQLTLRQEKVKDLSSIVKELSVAIASYNLSKGRELDQVRPNELVLYDAVKSADGSEQITSKTVYSFAIVGDSLTVFSRRYLTDDLDDATASEADDQATYDLEQQELQEIARNVISRAASEGGIAEPSNSQ